MVFGLFDLAKAPVLCMEEWQRNWLSVMAPGEAVSGMDGDAGSVTQPTAEELARSMDIAIGAQGV